MKVGIILVRFSLSDFSSERMKMVMKIKVCSVENEIIIELSTTH